MKTDRGFTLIEILAALLIFTIVIGGIYLLLEHGFRVWYQTSEETNLRNQANLLMAYIQKDLGQTALPPNGEQAVVVSGDKLELEIRTGWQTTPPEKVMYKLQADSENGNRIRLYRQASASGSEIPVSRADIDLSGSSFELIGNLIRIHLQLQGPRNDVYALDASTRYLLGR